LTTDDTAKNLKKVIELIKPKAKTSNEHLCINAIETLIKDIDKPEILSKRAVMVFIREITGLSSKQLSVVLSSLRKYYKIAKEEMNQ
jgi:hypothetical protein